ncbi:hypothetical protein AMJ87_13065 [candidate division WOR_3 bacterium SM23_60]|uniref:Uncharacterized protein n=1 Tax=candidate division WOR_3 bacterium SM23_60 TaxID=1703780 RepID=A0A0S8G3S4_UNCW3|nr:MAG: hypothetical protein AMJ87_13065 [candidate division WOR_3 bacterium SM23_60]
MLQFFPLMIRLGWLLTGIVFLFVTHVSHQKLFSHRVFKESKRALIFFLLLVALCYVLFRSKTVLLGDGYLRLHDLESSRIFSATAPLTTLLHNFLYQIISAFEHGHGSARLTYTIISIGAGIIAAALYYHLAKEWFPRRMWYAVILLFGLGLNVVFFGYVENYALFIAATWCYLWFGMRSLVEQHEPYAATFTCALCLSLHTAGLFLIPSLLVLWWYTLIRRKRVSMRKIAVNGMLLIAVPLSTVVLARLLAGPAQFSYILTEVPRKSILPICQDTADYTILSCTHLSDVGNQLLLIAPVGIFLLVGLLATGVRIRLNRNTFFLLAACVGAVSFLLFMNPELGMRKDWDVFAWTGVPLVCTLLFFMRSNKASSSLMPVAASVSLWLLLPWLGVNASESLAVERYKTILHDETKLVAYSYGNLALYYEEINQPDLEEWAHCQAAQREPENAKAAYLCGKKFLKHGKPDSAVKYLQRAAMLDSMEAVYWRDFGTALIYSARYEDALRALYSAIALDSTNSTAYASLGTVYMQLRQWELADSAFSRAYELSADDPWFYLCWARVQLETGQYARALHSCENALRTGARREHVMPLYKQAEAAIQKKKQ